MDERLDCRELGPSLARTCAPLAEARTLPGTVYAADAIHDLECRRLFAELWLAVARQEDFGAAGSFVTEDLGDEHILVVRDASGSLNAFHNVCRHRGARLITEMRGRLRGAISCPYHAWTYGLDGRLQRAPRMSVGNTEAMALALSALPLAAWEGFVFANLDGKAPRLGAAAGGLPDLARFRLGELCRVARLEYEVACNWKIVCENYSECYHCPGVHPQLSRLSDLSSGGFESQPGYNSGPMQLRAGVDTLSMSGRSSWHPLAAGSAAPGSIGYYLVYPNLMLGIHPDYVLTHRVWPISARRARVDCELLVRPESLAGPGFDPTEVVEFWDLTNRQDWALCERVQQGTASRGYRPGPYHPSERCVHAFDRWYAEWLQRALGAAATTSP